MEEKERYEVKRLKFSLDVKLTDNYEPDWRYIIFDDVNDKEFARLETVCNFLNQQDKEIKELEHRLSNCIEPKFKIGQEVYKVYTKNQRYPFKVKIIGFKITKTRGEDNIYYDTEEDGFEMGWYTDEILFATEEEARKRLEELNGD